MSKIATRTIQFVPRKLAMTSFQERKKLSLILSIISTTWLKNLWSFWQNQLDGHVNEAMASASFLTSNSAFSILHQILKDQLRLYWRGANLGFHITVLLKCKCEATQASLQTDEVVKSLRLGYVSAKLTWINDKIHHEICPFCSMPCLKQAYVDLFDQVVKSLRLDYVSAKLPWINDKIHHEIYPFCSMPCLKQAYVDLFDQVFI